MPRKIYIGSFAQKIGRELTDFELIAIFESARIALSDAELFDSIADKLDVSDDCMKSIQEKVASVLE